MRVSDDPGCSVLVSQDIKPHPGQGTARCLIDQVQSALAPTWASFVAQHCNHGGALLRVGGEARGGHLGIIAGSPGYIKAAKEATSPRVQTVGESPGHGWSRTSLRRCYVPRQPFAAGLALLSPRDLRPPSPSRSPPRSRGRSCAMRGRGGWPCVGGRVFLRKAFRVSAFRSNRGRRPSRSSTPC